MLKRMTIVWGIITAIFVYLLVNYTSNEIMISNYKKGEYNNNPLSIMGFYEPYVEDYNRGNIAYKNDDFEMAVTFYEEALTKNPPVKKECSIRINLVLAKLNQIDFDNITEEDKNDVIRTLDDCIDILCEDECATRDGKGHNADAQQLEEDIEALKKQLNETSEDVKDNHDNTKDDNNETKEDNNNEQKKDKLKEDQQKGQEERSGELREDKELSDYDYYDGKRW